MKNKETTLSDREIKIICVGLTELYMMISSKHINENVMVKPILVKDTKDILIKIGNLYSNPKNLNLSVENLLLE